MKKPPAYRRGALHVWGDLSSLCESCSPVRWNRKKDANNEDEQPSRHRGTVCTTYSKRCQPGPASGTVTFRLDGRPGKRRRGIRPPRQGGPGSPQVRLCPASHRADGKRFVWQSYAACRACSIRWVPRKKDCGGGPVTRHKVARPAPKFRLSRSGIRVATFIASFVLLCACEKERPVWFAAARSPDGSGPRWQSRFNKLGPARIA